MHPFRLGALVFISILLMGCGGVERFVIAPETVLVAGATGRAGSAICQELKKQGYRVIAMTRNMEKARQKFGEDWVWVEA